MAKKKKSTLLTRLFGNRNKVTDFMTEEQLQSPGRLILKNFLHNRLGMTGLIVFLLIFLLVMIGPKFYTLDLSYQDNTQLNVAPGMNMMKIPDGMKHKVADISPGTTYGVGCILPEHCRKPFLGFILQCTLDSAGCRAVCSLGT